MICTGNCEFCRVHKELNYESLIVQENSEEEIVDKENSTALSITEPTENYIVTKRFNKLIARKQ